MFHKVFKSKSELITYHPRVGSRHVATDSVASVSSIQESVATAPLHKTHQQHSTMIAGHGHVQISRSARLNTFMPHYPTTLELQGFILITRASRWPCIWRSDIGLQVNTQQPPSQATEKRAKRANMNTCRSCSLTFLITEDPTLIPLCFHCGMSVWHSCHPTLPRSHSHHIGESRPQSPLTISRSIRGMSA